MRDETDDPTPPQVEKIPSDDGERLNRTLLVHHPSCENHEIPFHCESPLRTFSIKRALFETFPDLSVRVASEATSEQLELFHTAAHISRTMEIFEIVRRTGEIFQIDPDTGIGKNSIDSVMFAAGAACTAVDEIFAGRFKNCFCCVRPPGHHATPSHSMGFCTFNNVGIAAMWAQHKYDVEKVAVVDFDVHHGNGTQEKFQTSPNCFFASSHVGFGFYPGTGKEWERGVDDNVVNVPLRPGSGPFEFKAAYEGKILPALREFGPGMIFISAGFDAHKDDPVGEMELTEEDFGWVTKEICKVAEEVCEGRVVSVLEGGYDIDAIVASAKAHVRALMESPEPAFEGGNLGLDVAAKNILEEFAGLKID